MAKEWRIGIIGVGMVGEWHVRVTPRIAGAKLVALCDLIPDKCHRAMEKYNLSGIPVYTDYHEMLKKENLDVVTIAIPSGMHMDMACELMQLGKHVICEKPMDIKLEKIDRMIETAQKCKVHLAGIFQNRWNEANRTLHDAVQQNRFGKITWAGSFTPWYRTDEYYADGGWRGTWDLDGGGAVMNQSVHAIDLLQWIVGPVKEVNAHACAMLHPKIQVEDTLSATLLFENGAFGTILGTTAMYPGGPVRIWVGGENGTAISEAGLHTYKFREEKPGDEELRQRLSPTRTRTGAAGGRALADVGKDLHGKNLNAILRAWDEGKEAETWGPEARKAVAIILAMYESSRKNGAPVKVS